MPAPCAEGERACMAYALHRTFVLQSYFRGSIAALFAPTTISGETCSSVLGIEEMKEKFQNARGAPKKAGAQRLLQTQ